MPIFRGICIRVCSAGITASTEVWDKRVAVFDSLLCSSKYSSVKYGNHLASTTKVLFKLFLSKFWLSIGAVFCSVVTEVAPSLVVTEGLGAAWDLTENRYAPVTP